MNTCFMQSSLFCKGKERDVGQHFHFKILCNQFHFQILRLTDAQITDRVIKQIENNNSNADKQLFQSPPTLW